MIHRFTATTTEEALAKVHEQLGSDAIIHSTELFSGGVKITASPVNDDTHNKIIKPLEALNQSELNALVDQLNHQLNMVYENVRKLSNHKNINSENPTSPPIDKNENFSGDDSSD